MLYELYLDHKDVTVWSGVFASLADAKAFAAVKLAADHDLKVTIIPVR